MNKILILLSCASISWGTVHAQPLTYDQEKYNQIRTDKANTRAAMLNYTATLNDLSQKLSELKNIWTEAKPYVILDKNNQDTGTIDTGQLTLEITKLKQEVDSINQMMKNHDPNKQQFFELSNKYGNKIQVFKKSWTNMFAVAALKLSKAKIKASRVSSADVQARLETLTTRLKKLESASEIYQNNESVNSQFDTVYKQRLISKKGLRDNYDKYQELRSEAYKLKDKPGFVKPPRPAHLETQAAQAARFEAAQ